MPSCIPFGLAFLKKASALASVSLVERMKSLYLWFSRTTQAVVSAASSFSSGRKGSLTVTPCRVSCVSSCGGLSARCRASFERSGDLILSLAAREKWRRRDLSFFILAPLEYILDIILKQLCKHKSLFD